MPRVLAWAQVEKTWNAGSSHCLRCPHRRELTSPPTDALNVQLCRLLAEPGRFDVTDCPGFGAVDPVNELEERARTGFCVAVQPRGWRDLFHNPAPILIGGAHQRRLVDQGQSAELLQGALLDSRTTAKPPVLLGLAALFWNRFC